MSDYIKREDFIKLEQARYCRDCERRKGMKCGEKVFCYEIGDAPCRACGIDDLLTDLEDLPAADVRENVHGRWITDGLSRSFGRIRTSCSRCGAFALYEFVNVGRYNEALSIFCPNCGADMREQEAKQ